MNSAIDEALRSLGLENAAKIASLQNIMVNRTRACSQYIPVLRGKDLKKVAVLTPEGKVQKIAATPKEGHFDIRFQEVPANVAVTLEIYHADSKPSPAPVQTKPAPVVAPPPVKSKGIVGKVRSVTVDPLAARLQKKHQAILADKQRRREAIRAQNPTHPGLKDKRVLTFDHTGGWARGLGMIQKAVQLRHELRRPLREYYQRITGQGDGAIVAAALAAGISPDKLAEWWLSDWRKAHTPGNMKALKRWAKSKVFSNISGFDAKKAGKALRKLFTHAGGRDLLMSDVLTELHVTVIQADFKISVHMSDQHPNLELWCACEDSAVTKMDYDQKTTIKGEAVFLGAIEKNDVLGMAVSPDNEGLEVTSIGASVRVDPDGAMNLDKLGDAADKAAFRAGAHFVYEKRVEQLIEKLTEVGYKIRYLRLECEPIDEVVSTATTDRAMNAGLDSGKSAIELPDWLRSGLAQISA